jgi:ectoine hydroxylase-related dioxygenase (phytanoyl-CoA dioxygenase family)
MSQTDSSGSQLKAAFADQVEVKPAAHVWTDPMPGSPAEQVAFFRENGFLILQQTLSAAELEELDHELARLARDHASLPHVREGFDLEPKQDPTRSTPTFRKIGGIGTISEPFIKLMRHPRIVQPLHELLGDTIELYRDVVMMKPARVGREKPWHQDSVYWPYQPMSLVSAMTALDDATPANGCLEVIPGTHANQLQHYGKELQIDIDDDMQARTWYVPLAAGDTLLFHSLLLHASEPNRSDHDRRVCIFSYKTPDLEYIGKGDPGQPIIVSQR